MCWSCDEDIAEVGGYLDSLLRAEREVRHVLSGETSQQHTMRLTSTILDAIGQASTPEAQTDAIEQIALGFSCAVTRLIAAQDIYGMPS